MLMPLEAHESESHSEPVNLLQRRECEDLQDKASNPTCRRSLAALPLADDFRFLDSARETLYYHFGFKTTVETPPPSTDPLPSSAVSHVLGEHQSEWIERPLVDPISGRDIKDDVSTFFGYLSKAKKPDDMPAELYDLRQPDLAPLRPSPIQLRWEIINKITYYFFTPKDPVPDGALESVVVRSATFAVEILRRDWMCLEEVVLNLLARGIAFNTLVRASPAVSPQIKGSVELAVYRGLGYRAKDFQAHPGEYARYEAIRNQFLSSGRGRAALLMGGVIARLARGVVSSQSVCCGPTKTVRDNGRCFWDGLSSSPAYWDDVLTAAELDLICGVYEVATGQRDSHRDGQQTRCVSWWPLPGAWQTSGLNMGHWTPACEAWFQQRLAQIRAGDTQCELQTLSQWRNNLKGDWRCMNLWSRNEQLAEAFLAENGTRIMRGTDAQQFLSTIFNQQRSSDGFYFGLRTEHPESPTAECAAVEADHDPPVAANKQAPTPEIQQITREFWDTRRKISTTLVRGREIEQKLRALHVKRPDIIYLSSSELSNRLARVQAELATERSRVREAENIFHDIQRECKTPTVVPQLLEAMVEG
ncbi:hypothetical protein B0H15DRAFT_817142 [Mycena belliarum]|uniref:Uncharacterized protein n=1 Tax=Mycena belliarum TaxID=1033014 RepID=A0AAD6UFK8_9AGAR|nr:hypothetical protein B0H15DRAFT_817142 [Mycena belliae]